MAKLEPYLPDAKVHAVQAKLFDENPILVEYGTDFATTRIEPPWHGQLPDGTTRTTTHPVVQFVVISDHPRPIQRAMGVRHATVATAWERAFSDASKERDRYVIGDKMDPLESIFRGVLAKHLEEMSSLKSIIRDAVADPSKPKSALDAL